MDRRLIDALLERVPPALGLALEEALEHVQAHGATTA